MKYIVSIAIALTMITFTGCNEETTVKTQPPAVVQPPQRPSEPVQPIEPVPTIPTAGIGSIKANMDCEGGTITTKYSFGNVAEDQKNFVMQYERNGELEDLTYPSTSTTGSRTTVTDVYFVRPNDDDRAAYWVVTISYQTPDETYDLVTTTIKQQVCDDNLTAVTTEYKVY